MENNILPIEQLTITIRLGKGLNLGYLVPLVVEKLRNLETKLTKKSFKSPLISPRELFSDNPASGLFVENNPFLVENPVFAEKLRETLSSSSIRPVVESQRVIDDNYITGCYELVKYMLPHSSSFVITIEKPGETGVHLQCGFKLTPEAQKQKQFQEYSTEYDTKVNGGKNKDFLRKLHTAFGPLTKWQKKNAIEVSSHDNWKGLLSYCIKDNDPWMYNLPLEENGLPMSFMSYRHYYHEITGKHHELMRVARIYKVEGLIAKYGSIDACPESCEIMNEFDYEKSQKFLRFVNISYMKYLNESIVTSKFLINNPNKNPSGKLLHNDEELPTDEEATALFRSLTKLHFP